MKKKVVSISLSLLTLILMLSGCGCKHEYSSIVSKEASCVEEGELTYTCSLCGKTYTEIVPKSNNHKYSANILKEATCAETGEVQYVCEICGNTYNEDIPKSNQHDYTSEITVEPTTVLPGTKTYTCSICGDTYTETIPKIESKWEKQYYVDEFGDKTSNSYYVASFDGTFSNSATTNSELTAIVFLDSTSDLVSFRLIEYGWSKATFLSSETITLKTKDSSGNIEEYFLYSSSSSGDIFAIDYKLYRAIKNSDSLSCVITTSSKYQSVRDTYQFKIENTGLKDL